MIESLAVINKVIIHSDNLIEYKPIKVIRGIYDNEKNILYDKDMTPYSHIINGPNTYGFSIRRSISDWENEYPKLPLFVIKRKILKYAKEKIYNAGYLEVNDENIPVIITNNKDNTKVTVFLDADIITYYIDNYPEFIEMHMKESEEKISNYENKVIPINNSQININKLYKEKEEEKKEKENNKKSKKSKTE